MERQLEAGLTADYRIEGRSAVTPVGPATLTAATRVPGVRTAVPLRTVRFALDGTVHTATAGDARQLTDHFRLRLLSGRVPDGDHHIAAGRSVAASNGWRTGSTIAGRYQDGTRATFRITAIYADIKTPYPSSVPTLIIDLPDRPTTTVLGDSIDRIEVTVAPGADPVATRSALQAALAPWPNLDLKDREAVKDEASGNIDLALRLILVLLMLSVLIAALGIVNTLALAVVERTREIGMLRAVGLQRRQTRSMIKYEALVVSLLGGLTGLGLGVLFGAAVRDALASEGIDVLSIPYGRLAAYLLAAALVGILASVWPAHRAARTNILHAMTSQ